MQVNIKHLIDDVQCYQTVRELRWPDGIACPSCESKQVIKRGFDDTEPTRQRYECHACHTRFDDLTDTIDIIGNRRLAHVAASPVMWAARKAAGCRKRQV